MNRSQTALLHAKEPQDAAFCASPVLPTTQLAENRPEAVREAVDAILLNCPDPLQVRDGAVHLYGVAQACALIALRRGEDAELAAKLDARRAADAAKVLEKDAALQAELNG